ncbi:MAG: hypothetical protein RJB31_1923, partial [Bacteroidota bacterium]
MKDELDTAALWRQAQGIVEALPARSWQRLTHRHSATGLHARKRMQEAIEFNLKRVFGQEIQIQCQIQGLDAESRTARRKILPDVKHIIAIASGKGGVGKSTITANLAGGLAKKGFRVGI